MQSGAWTAVGFPVENADARHAFYTYANWVYQVGVFISRSSGLLYQVKALCISFQNLTGGLANFFWVAASAFDIRLHLDRRLVRLVYTA